MSNLVLAVIKGTGGILGHSNALIADAIESGADVLGSLLVLLGLKYAEKPPDENHPYGHGRIEPLVTFIVVVILVISATSIAFDSIQNIRSVQETPAPWTLLILGAIIIWKEVSFRYVRRKSRETHSTALKADAWHHRSDAITSVAAFIGIAIAVIFGEGYEKADDWAALLAAGFIMYNSYLIFRPALGEIMDEHVYDDLIEDIRQTAAGVEGILDTEKCFIRKTGMRYHCDLHAIVDGDISVSEGHVLAHRLKDVLLEKYAHLEQVLIHIEPFEPDYTP